MDKKLIRYVAIFVGVVILLMILMLIFNSASGGTKYSYEKIEDKLVNAAKKYVEAKKKQNIDILPESPLSDPLYLSATVLANEGYIKDLSEYAKDETTCVGGVNIYNAGDGNYDYIPELTCGTYHETVKLVDKIISDNDSGVTHGSGLYLRVDGKFITDEQDLYTSSEDLEYVFRGDDVNNYVKIDDNVWRIVSIDANNDMLLIFNEHSQRAIAWDDKYNEEEAKYQGVNTFESNGLESTAYKAIQEFYNGTLVLKDRETYSPKTKYLTVPMNLCIGKRSVEDTDISGNVECSVILEDQLVGLLPAYYYMSASLDPNCETITSKSCGNFNYLSQFDDFWWLMTANSANTNEAYTVSKKYAEASLCNYKADIRPTIKLGSRAVYLEGDGSKDNPYQIRFYNE